MFLTVRPVKIINTSSAWTANFSVQLVSLSFFRCRSVVYSISGAGLAYACFWYFVITQKRLTFEIFDLSLLATHLLYQVTDRYINVICTILAHDRRKERWHVFCNLKHVGMTLTFQNYMYEEIKISWRSENACYRSFQNVSAFCLTYKTENIT